MALHEMKIDKNKIVSIRKFDTYRYNRRDVKAGKETILVVIMMFAIL